MLEEKVVSEKDSRPWMVQQYESFFEFHNNVCQSREGILKQGRWDEYHARREAYLASEKPRGSDLWDMSTDYPESVKLMECGWREGVERSETLAADIIGVTGQHKMEEYLEYDVTGTFMDIGEFMAGTPECMATLGHTEQPGEGKVISIGVNIFASCYVTGAQLAMRGAAHLALITALESAGYRISLDVIMAGRGEDFKGVCTIIPVINTKWAMDRDLLAFVLAHPAFMRRQGFRSWELFPPEYRKACGIGDYYCIPRDCDIVSGRYDMYSPGFHADTCDFTDQEGACEWVNERLEQFNAKVEA